MMRTYRLGLLVGLVLAAVLVLNGPAVAQVKIRVGKAVAAQYAFVPADVAKEQGFFSKRGLDVEILAFRGGAPMAQAMAAGSLEIALDGITSSIGAIAKGSEARVVFATHNSLNSMVLIVNPRTITKVEDLAGRKIGVTSHGAITDWLVRRVSEHLGKGPTGITTVPLGPLDGQRAAFATGQTDGFVWTYDAGRAMEKAGAGKILLSFGDYLKDVDFEYMVVRQKLLSENLDAVKRFIEAWVEGVQYMKKNRDYAIQKGVAVTKIPAEAIAEVHDNDIRTWSETGEISRKGLEFVLQSLVRDGILTEPVPAERIVEPTLARFR